MSFGHEKLDLLRRNRLRHVLEVCGALTAEDNDHAKALLDRIVAMLTKLGQRGYVVHEDIGACRAGGADTDSDTDPDPERRT